LRLSANRDCIAFALGGDRRAVAMPAYLRRATPIKPSGPEPNSQTATGIGTGTVVSSFVPNENETLAMIEPHLRAALRCHRQNTFRPGAFSQYLPLHLAQRLCGMSGPRRARGTDIA